jgi:hypothetical protein
MVVQPPVVLPQRVGSLAHSRPAGHFFKTLRSSLGLSFSAVVKLSGHLRAMSPLGHKRKWCHAPVMSVLPLKADIRERKWHVRYVPLADIQASGHLARCYVQRWALRSGASQGS